MVLMWLPDKPVRPNMTKPQAPIPPPPISKDEINLLLPVFGRDCVVYTDGAKNYQDMKTAAQWLLKVLGHHKVSHTHLQFTKRVSVKGETRLAGTQLADGIWKHLQRSIPHGLNTRKKERMMEHMRLWQWMYHSPRSVV